MDLRTKLDETTVNGVTKTLYIGRVQTDPSPAGGAVLTVFPDQVITDSAGNILATGFQPSFPVPLTPAQYTGITTIIKSAYDALP